MAASIGEVAGLSVPEGDLIHYVDQVNSDNPVGVRDWTGARLALHAVSSGLAVLALRAPADIDADLAGPLERFTARTMNDPTALRERLRRIQRDGYAWTAGEYTEDISSVATAIADASGEVVAAIHVHGPSYRFPAPGREAALGLQVVAMATRTTSSPASRPQERKILLLVAEGKTNKTIAAEIFLSDKTVKNYVSSILAKLNLEPRAQAAAFVARHRLKRGG